MDNEERREIIQLIEDFCKNGDARFRNNYSGRGMYGAECVAVTTKDAGYAAIGLLTAYIAEYGNDDTLEEWKSVLKYTRSDDMGTGTVIYWPGLKL